MTSPNDGAVRTDKFLGLRNTLHPLRHPNGALAKAANVDLDDTGALQRRNGYTKVASAIGVSAAYATRDQRWLYLVDNGELRAYTSPTDYVVLRTDLSTKPMFWCEAGDVVFASNADTKLMIHSTQCYDWAVPDGPAVGASVVSGGPLPPGQYLIAAAHVDATGRQGPALVASVELVDYSSIKIEVAPDAGYDAAIYLSAPNGETLYLSHFQTGGVVEVRDISRLGAPISEHQLGTQPVPDGDVVEFYESELWVAQYDQASDTTFVFHSKPFWWHLFDLERDFVPVPGRVLALRRSVDSLVIATDRDLWRYQDGLLRLRPYGAIRGYPAVATPDQSVLLWTSRGVFRYPSRNPNSPLGDDLTLDKFSVPPGAHCSTGFVEQDGARRFVVLTDTSGTAHNAYPSN